MSKILFSQEAIAMLKQHEQVTYTSEKFISFTPKFRVEARCKTKYDAVELFESAGINPALFGKQRLNSLYDRYKNQYRKKDVAAFISEFRGRKKLKIRKPMKLQI